MTIQFFKYVISLQYKISISITDDSYDIYKILQSCVCDK